MMYFFDSVKAEKEHVVTVALVLYMNYQWLIENLTDLLITDYEIYDSYDEDAHGNGICLLHIPISQLRDRYRHAILGEPEGHRVVSGYFECLNNGYADMVIFVKYCKMGTE